MELEGYGRPTRRKQPRRADRRQQARPSTSFVGNTIDLLWRNFLSTQSFGQSSSQKCPYFEDTRISLKRLDSSSRFDTNKRTETR